MSGKVTRESLTDLIARKMGIKKYAARQFVDLTISRMEEGLIRDEKLMLSDFGRFRVLSKKERPGRNPKTGKETRISARKSIAFKQSHGLKLT
jgi:nucleoid DNA-binding protein